MFCNQGNTLCSPCILSWARLFQLQELFGPQKFKDWINVCTYLRYSLWMKTSAVLVGTAPVKWSSLILSSVLEWHDHWNLVYSLFLGQGVVCLDLTIWDTGSLRFRNYILLELPDVRLVIEKSRIFGGGILPLHVVYKWGCKKRRAVTEGRILFVSKS
jgi:hypothetical protein